MMGAKVELRALVLLLPVLQFLWQLGQSHGSTTHFSFQSFSKNNSNELIYMGNASFSPSHGYINLTPSPNSTSATDQYSSLQSCIGRVLYSKPITVWPASFTTTFTLLVHNMSTSANAKYGDGLAFIIVPNEKVFLPNSYGQFLGLFDGSTYQNTTNQLAVEFDTFKNIVFDPDDNHVGIDVKSITSEATANLGQHGINLKSGRPISVRIDYDGWNKTLQIYAAYADRPISYASILNHTIELSSIVPQSAYLGFSASTGISVEIHRIWNWNFSSVILPESSLNRAPDGTPRSGGASTTTGLKVGLLVGSIAIGSVLLGLSVWFVARTLKRRKGTGTISGELAMIQDQSAGSSYGPHRISYKLLSAATNNFSEARLLGTGGFGSVYKGTLEGRDGAPIHFAVKRVSAASRQGKREFITEISTIGRLRHRNLVRLQGWCHEREELLLVYDYMPNGSLDRVIFRPPGDKNQNQPLLNWGRRHRILCGLASALLYLHEEWEQRVLHRDIKPSNVMLDGDFNARLGDFGLARFIEHDEASPAVTTKLAGTPGYWAPECGYTGKATAESDVYSFGVVVLEVASGMRVMERTAPWEEGNLMDWIWGLHGQERVLDAADPRLNGHFDEEQMKRALILGLACSHPDPQMRPPIGKALQILVNPNEQMMPVASTRPLAIYVVLPPVPRPNSHSALLGSSSGVASITASVLHLGR